MLRRAVNKMIRLIVFATLFVSLNTVSVRAVVYPGPQHPPTEGGVWPKPQQQITHDTYYSFDPSQFDVKITNYNCRLLINAKERYVYVFKVLHKLANKYALAENENSLGLNRSDLYQGLIKELQIELTAPCEDYPYLEMDESYNLTVSTEAKLRSSSVWGVLRGLETFSQLFYLTDDYQEVHINSTTIVDYPLYQHRGLLLDTSRHFVTMRNILRTLDAMAMNKMNVFHWHIVDDQSFPYQSELFPDLSAKGAFHPSMVYTRDNIKTVVEYATERGIRVLPEFDVPGHTRSWGEAYPNILTECYRQGKVIGLGPMDPTKNITYKLIRDLFREVQEWFPDKYFHVGGDEVEMSCWQSNPSILEYMVQNNISNVNDLHAIFMRNTIPLLASRSQPIVWQEVFDEGVPLSNDTLVQVWKGAWGGISSTNEMIRVLKAGYKVLYSTEWYLDHLGDTFEKFYKVDPRQDVSEASSNESLAQNVVGGEACMWGEMMDDSNLLPRVWPRASAVAERLWNSIDAWGVPEDVLRRIEEHACRMVRRGIPAQPPSGPGYCLA